MQPTRSSLPKCRVGTVVVEHRLHALTVILIGQYNPLHRFNRQFRQKYWPLEDSLWNLNSGATLRDGAGRLRTLFRASHVKVAYGQRRWLVGSWHVFAVAVTGDEATVDGWVRESDMGGCFATTADCSALRISDMPTCDPPRVQSILIEAREFVRGNSSFQFSSLEKCLPCSRCLAESRSCSIACTSDASGDRADDDDIRLWTSTPSCGGVPHDVFSASANAPKFYVAAPRAVPEVRRQVYDALDICVSHDVVYLYGRVLLNGTHRYGWVSDQHTRAPRPR